MNISEPPPVPPGKQTGRLGGPRVLRAFVVVIGIIGLGVAILRMMGLIHPFSVPTSGMAPAVTAGDHVLMEGLTLLIRKPSRGDIIVFKTEGISRLPPGTTYLKRVVGLPGDRLRISEGKLFVNDAQVTLRNEHGEIHYLFWPGSSHLASDADVENVPEGEYFVLGDNSRNSSDSRMWGCVPARNILGRISFCYWPPQRIGSVK